MEKEDSSTQKIVSSPRNLESNTSDVQKDPLENSFGDAKSLIINEEGLCSDKNKEFNDLKDEMNNSKDLNSYSIKEADDSSKNLVNEFIGEDKEEDPVFDGTEVLDMEALRGISSRSLDGEGEPQGSVWPEKATALKNFVKEKSIVVSTVLRRLSGKKDEFGQGVFEDVSVSPKEADSKEASPKPVERFTWNPLSFIKMSRDFDRESKTGHQEEAGQELIQSITMRGRVTLYTRLGCQNCKEARLFLHWKRLRYVEINIDVYPSRKLELEKISGSSTVPMIFFNEILIGGLSEIKELNESGKLDDKINYLIAEQPSTEAPIPPLSGEDDVSDSGTVDDLAVVARKMRGSIVIKDRFYKLRWFTNCFLGSDAVNFLSEDQYLEREEAIEFGRKLATQLLFTHVLNENVFEDSNHLYRFLDDDPIVLSQCHNIPNGIVDVKPKSIVEIAARLRLLSHAIFEAYTSEDGKHLDYKSIQGSEEFARYVRVVQELPRVDLQDMLREEKLAFFINLYNMMAIHAILVLGYPIRPLERRKLLGDFKYVIGECTYSLSSIYNGILRGNQRPPYNLIKPFGIKDKRSKVALPYPEPLIHFALVCGNRSGPAFRCYSPGDIDKELVEVARNFLRHDGLILDLNAKVISVNKILKWYNVDFGKNETEMLKHVANYIDPTESEALLELLANGQLKVIYQPYDWGLNC